MKCKLCGAYYRKSYYGGDDNFCPDCVGAIDDEENDLAPSQEVVDSDIRDVLNPDGVYKVKPVFYND